MKTKYKVVAFLLLTSTFFNPVSVYAVDKDDYASSVLEILRMHVALLEQLSTSSRFKYSDNLVRHAVAIKSTFGLLGPMEWHAAESASIAARNKGANVDLNEEMFEDLEKASRKSLRDLVLAAHDSMEQHDAEGVIAAIKDLKKSCENCHSHLPKSVAPDLWGTLQRAK